MKIDPDGKQTNPAEEVRELADQLAGHRSPYDRACDRVEDLEEELAMAKAEKQFEANKLNSLLAAMKNPKAATPVEARVFDDFLRKCLSQVKATKKDYSGGVGYGRSVKIAGVVPWSELAKRGATDQQILTNIKKGFEHIYNGGPAAQDKGGETYRLIIEAPRFVREIRYGHAGVVLLRQPAKEANEDLLLAIRRVMNIGEPKAPPPPPKKKPAKKLAIKMTSKPTVKKLAATAAKSGVRLTAPPAKFGLTAQQAKAKHRQTWGQWLATLRGTNATSNSSLEAINNNMKFFQEQYEAGKRPSDARNAWNTKELEAAAAKINQPRSSPEQVMKLPPPASKQPKKSKVKASPVPPAPAASKRPPEQEAMRVAVLMAPAGRSRLEAFLRDHKGEPGNDEVRWFLDSVFIGAGRLEVSGEIAICRTGKFPTLAYGGKTYKGDQLCALFRRTFLKDWPLPEAGSNPPAAIPPLENQTNISAPAPSIAVGKLAPGLFPRLSPTIDLLDDDGKGIPAQPAHQSLTWHQWAPLVRRNDEAKNCRDWPRQRDPHLGAIPRVDPETPEIRSAYLAGRKPAQAARDLAKLYTVRAAKADADPHTLSEEEENALEGAGV